MLGIFCGQKIMNWRSGLDFLLPWNFSPTVLVVVVVAATLFTGGARNSAPPTLVRRRLAFYLGLALIYAALQTKWDYYAGHMFFVHRLQHFVLQDVGPFLLAFSAPGSALASGVPTPVRARLRGALSAFGPLARVISTPGPRRRCLSRACVSGCGRRFNSPPC